MSYVEREEKRDESFDERVERLSEAEQNLHAAKALTSVLLFEATALVARGLLDEEDWSPWQTGPEEDRRPLEKLSTTFCNWQLHAVSDDAGPRAVDGPLVTMRPVHALLIAEDVNIVWERK